MNATKRMLEVLNATFPDIASMTPLAAREAVDSRIRPATNIDDAHTEDVTLTSPHGPLPVRVYRSHTTQPNAPVTVYAHGGGFLHGSIESHDSFCRTWAKHTGSTVLSVGYRLAPEHGAPAPAEDIMTATQWAVSERIGERLVLAGDSSGANAAAVASLMCRDEGIAVSGQILLYPFLDPEMNTPSHTERATGYFVTRTSLAMYWETYLSAPGSSTAPEWTVNPARATSHAHLPPTIVYTAGLDPLCDEGNHYASLLRAAGTPTLSRHFPDQFHGFLTIPGYPPASAAQDLLWSDFMSLTHVKESTAS